MTTIEWTRGPNGEPGESWNFLVGCNRVSAGCDNCYAMHQAHRGMSPQHRGLTKLRPPDADRPGVDWNGKVHVVEHRLAEPLHWREPRRVFVNSMSDLFHKSVDDALIATAFGIMAACPQHTFLLLTKRLERARDFFGWLSVDALGEQLSEPDFSAYYWATHRVPPVKLPPFRRTAWPLPNVHIGASVEDQATFDERVPLLLQCPAALHWISFEPALGYVDLEYGISSREREIDHRRPADGEWFNVPTGRRLGWVVVGGESGPRARPFNAAWARSVVRDCHDVGVPAFVKQLGAVVHDRNDAGFEGDDQDAWPESVSAEHFGYQGPGHQGATCRVRLRDRKGADMAEWPEALRVRQYPGAVAA